MTTAVPSAAHVTIQPVFTDAERVALAGLLAGYRGLTCEAYALDLRQFASWCRTRPVALFAVRRADIEGFARDLKAMGRAPRHGHPAAGPARGRADRPQDRLQYRIGKLVTPHTLRYDRARSSLDRHATYIVSAYLAGAAR